MATLPQLNYAKKLILGLGGDPIDYPMSEATPHKAISPLIESLKKRIAVSPSEWEKMISLANEEETNNTPEATTTPNNNQSDITYTTAIFDEDLKHIDSLFLRGLAKSLLTAAPDYFWVVPASSTGKYHPNYALGKGGLVRHVKAAVKIAISLFENPSLGNYTRDEKDIALVAIICHDLCKSGLTKQQYTVIEHPLLVKKLLTPEMLNLLSDEQAKMVDAVFGCIETHMGPWTKDYSGKEVLQEPKTKLQRFVHMCDYLASRKFLEVIF